MFDQEALLKQLAEAEAQAAAVAIPFDPGYDQQQERDAYGAIQKLSIQTSEELVLTAPNVKVRAPAGYRHVPVPASGDLYVNGDVVRIEGKLLLPGRAVQINARIVELECDSAGNGPGIDVSGAPPSPADVVAPQGQRAGDGNDAHYEYKFLVADKYTPPGKGTSGEPGLNGAPGAAGKNAGWIDLRCGRLIAGSAVRDFEISAAGGRGGDGQGGQRGQDGGNGGKGADAWEGGIADSEDATDGANAGAGGPGGRGGPGGPGGSGGSIALYSAAELPGSTTITARVEPGPPGSAGADGAPGADGHPGAGGAAFVSARNARVGGVATILPAGHSGGIEPPKAQRNPLAASTAVPEQGTKDIKGDCPYATVASSVRANQLTMLLARIRHDGLGLDRSRSADVVALGDRIAWLSASSAACPAGSVADEVAPVRLAAAAIRKNFGHPLLDWFGHTLAWAPTVSLSEYDELLDSSLKLFDEAETTYSNYRAARNARLAAAHQIESVGSVINGQLNALRDSQAALRARLETLAADIASRDKPIEDARKAVLEAEAQFKANVKKKVTLSLWKYLDVIEQTAFAMSDPVSGSLVFATEEAKFWKGAFTELPGDDGQSIPKDYMVRQLDTFGDTVKTLDEAYSAVDGYLKLKDKDGYKLLCSQKSLDDLLDNFHSVDGADEAREAMDAYVKEVLARNQSVLDYDATRSDLAQNIADTRQLRAQKDVVDAKAVQVQPPVVDRSIQSIYDHVKQACIDDLYRAARAYRFWSLRDYDVFADVLQCSGPQDVGHLQLSAGRNLILSNRVSDLERFVGALQVRRHPITVSFDASRHKRIRKEFARDRGVEDDGTKRAHFWEFELQPGDERFVDMANVRLAEVRAWLIGLRPPGGRSMKVHLTQRGNEHVVTPTGDIVAVQHDPVEKIFEYAGDPGSGGVIETHAYYWDQDAAPRLGEPPTYTPIGPFATWRIGLRPQIFGEDVDWGALVAELAEVRLEFFVRFQGPNTN